MRTWPHAPSRVVTEAGNWMVTAATYQKQPLFQDPRDLELLHDTLLAIAEEQGWLLDAWAVFSNHYHLIGRSPDRENAATRMAARVHRETAVVLNRRHETPGRQVWFRSWPTRVTFHRSYLARMAYVHFNPVRHGLVDDPAKYPWCSAKWFESHASAAFYHTITSLKTDRLNVLDDF